MIFLLAFESTHDALAAQKALSRYQPHVIPTPKDITAGCGMALRFEALDETDAQEIAAQTLLPENSFALFAHSNQKYKQVSL